MRQSHFWHWWYITKWNQSLNCCTNTAWYDSILNVWSLLSRCPEVLMFKNLPSSDGSDHCMTNSSSGAQPQSFFCLYFILSSAEVSMLTSYLWPYILIVTLCSLHLFLRCIAAQRVFELLLFYTQSNYCHHPLPSRNHIQHRKLTNSPFQEFKETHLHPFCTNITQRNKFEEKLK